MKKRLLPALLTLVMLLGMLPGTAWAGDNENGTTADTENVTVSTAEQLSDYIARQDVKVITLSGNINMQSENNGVLSVDKDLTIDCGGHTLNAFIDLADKTPGAHLTLKNGTLSSKVQAVWVQNGGVLTVESDMTVETASEDSNRAAIVVQGTGSTLNIYGKVKSGISTAISGIGNASDGGVIINIGATAEVTSTNEVAVYYPNTETLTIAGKVTGNTAVYQKSGTLIVKEGAVLTGNGTKADYRYWGNGCYPTGDALVVDVCDYPGGNPEVVIEGGTFTSTNNKAVAVYKKDADIDEKKVPAAFITGGTFSSDPRKGGTNNEEKTNYVSALCKVTVEGEGQAAKYKVEKADAIIVAKPAEGPVEITGDLSKTTVEGGEGTTEGDVSGSVTNTAVEVSVPSSETDKAAILVEIPAETVNTIQNSATLTIKTSAGTDGSKQEISVTLDKDAASAVKSAANPEDGESKNIRIDVKEYTLGSDATALDVKAAYDVEVKADGENIFASTGNGTITITVPKPDVTTVDNGKFWGVILSEGKIAEVLGELTPSGEGTLSIVMPHLSTAGIVYSAEEPAGQEVSWEAADGTTKHGSLKDALKNEGGVKTNGKITLLKDVELTETLTISGKTITIDGQGKYSIKAGTSLKPAENAVSNATMIKLTGSTKLTLADVTLDGQQNSRLITVGDTTELIVENGTKITNGNPGVNYIGGVFVTGTGKLTMNGGEIKGNETADAFKNTYLDYAADLWVGSQATAEINGGTVGKALANANKHATSDTAAVLTVTGGMVETVFVECETGKTAKAVVQTGGTIGNVLIAMDDAKNLVDSDGDVDTAKIATAQAISKDRVIAKVEKPEGLEDGIVALQIPAGVNAEIIPGKNPDGSDNNNLTLKSDITINEGATLIIPADVTVTVKKNEGGGGGGTIPAITNNGTIQVNGKLIAGDSADEEDTDYLNITGGGEINPAPGAVVDVAPNLKGKFKITLNANGGTFSSNVSEETVELDYVIKSDVADTKSVKVSYDNATLPKPTYEKHTFGGWRSQSGTEWTSGDYEFTADTTLTAIWNDIIVTKVTLNPTSASVKAGETLQLTATVSPSDATDQSVTWTSSNPSVAKVENGKVTGLKGGTATITATVGGQSATCTVTVVEPKPEEKPKPGDTDTPANPGNTGNDNTGSSGGGGGGGGGGTGKPSISNPGQTPAPGGPTSTNEGVAGFQDVAPGAWYAEYVQYVAEKGLFNGVSDGRFAPDANMTRAMMWTVLARYMGVNTNSGTGVWYAAAQAWAIENGISDGTMAESSVTREQFVTMLWRLSGEPAVSNSASFTDGGRISDYAKTAVAWAVAEGIVNGYTDGSFKPQGSATRAEVAKMLTVFCENAENAPAETAPEETVPEETTPEETTPTEDAPVEAVPDDEK